LSVVTKAGHGPDIAYQVEGDLVDDEYADNRDPNPSSPVEDILVLELGGIRALRVCAFSSDERCDSQERSPLKK
jgi:hypothetical protein